MCGNQETEKKQRLCMSISITMVFLNDPDDLG